MALLKRRQGVVLVVLVTGFVALCSGCCSTTIATGPAGNNTLHQEPVLDQTRNVVIDRRHMIGDVEIIDINRARVRDVLSVKIALRISPKSKDPDMVPLLYNFEWFDAQGTEIPANSVQWAPLMIFGRETQIIKGVAPDPRARDFKLKIQGPAGSHC